MQLAVRLVRVDFATGTAKVYPPWTDTYWQDPPEFRGLQLINTHGKEGAEVVALRCEWTKSGRTITKRKIAAFASEDGDEIRSYPVSQQPAAPLHHGRRLTALKFPELWVPVSGFPRSDHGLAAC